MKIPQILCYLVSSNSALKLCFFCKILCYPLISVGKNPKFCNSVLFVNSVLSCQFHDFRRVADNMEISSVCNSWNSVAQVTGYRWQLNSYTQNFRLMVRPRPWRIKIHYGRRWSQLDGPTTHQKTFPILGEIWESHLLTGQTTMYLVSLESSFKLPENGVYFMLLSWILFE